MPQFFIDSSLISDNVITIRERELFRHIVFVLRTKLGAPLRLIDENETVYEATIAQITTGKLTAKINSTHQSTRKLDYNINVAQCILKNEAQGVLIQKATELGVSEIYPLISDNISVKHDFAFARTPKWQKIAAEASKQCERANIPLIKPTSHLVDTVDSSEFDKILLFVESHATSSLKSYVVQNKFSKNDRILLVIGPEGGFSAQEFELFEKSKLPMLSLSNLILKAETAAIAAISNFVFGVCDE